MIGALGNSAAPRLARHYATGDYQAFSSLIRKLLCLALAVGAGGILLILLAGRPILVLLYQPEYGGRVSAFFWLGIAAGIGYPASLLGYGMTAARYFGAQLPVFLTVTLVTAAGCAVLVPRHQLSGAAIAMALGAICQAAGSAGVIIHALRRRGGKMKIAESTHRIRVLHIVGGMTRGGVETWLMHVLRHIDREQMQMDFMVHTAKACAYDDEVRALGVGSCRASVIPGHGSTLITSGVSFPRTVRTTSCIVMLATIAATRSAWHSVLECQCGLPTVTVSFPRKILRQARCAGPISLWRSVGFSALQRSVWQQV